MRRAIAVVCAALAAVPAAVAATVEQGEYRFVREVDAAGTGPIVVEPDGAVYAHARGGLVDVRVLDAEGNQVAWRRLPAEALASETLTVLNRGRQSGAAVALLDLGPEGRVHDRVELEIPDRNFVGRIVVSGSDRRGGPFTRLSATGIYDVRGARRARSTIGVFPPSDFRYLQLRATNVSTIQGAIVSGAGQRPRRIERPVRTMRVRQDDERTIVTVDLGFRNLPVDELRVTSDTAQFDRPLLVSGSNDGIRFVPLVGARIFRFQGSSDAPVVVQAHHRYLRLSIDNGDDEPLEGIAVDARARSRALLLEGGRPRPYELLYGNPAGRAPEYDFARLPRSALGLSRAVEGRLSGERPNPEFSAEGPPRSFADEHPRIVQLSLAAAALVVAFAGFLAFRRRA